MLSVRRARVVSLRRADTHAVELEVLADGEDIPRIAISYPHLTGPVSVGDIVHLNTTATALRLGTGGVDFVIFNEMTGQTPAAVYGDPDGTEHIVKLRYTPMQHAVRAVEMAPAYAEIWERDRPLDGTPIVVCELHSQVACVAAGIKAARPDARVAYVMTDGAALPLAFSRLARELTDAGLIDTTLTAGQAFGGEYECVTEASALIAARHVARADVIVVAQGPGNAGTGTRWGFSGLEQGALLDLAGVLGGKAIGVLRLSLADLRSRHYGLSHHSATAFERVAQLPAVLVFPTQPESIHTVPYGEIRDEVLQRSLAKRHRIVEADGAPGMALLAARGLRITSMGRSVEEDPVFFHAASAAGALAANG